LAPVFVEWLQGLEPGWVTALGVPRTAQLRALGNGVVPQQAAHAVALLLTDLGALLGDTDERFADEQEAKAA
jgi:DNA (cytosine-5)-methyltransferase 1